MPKVAPIVPTFLAEASEMLYTLGFQGTKWLTGCLKRGNNTAPGSGLDRFYDSELASSIEMLPC